jgi:hypothetical protein
MVEAKTAKGSSTSKEEEEEEEEADFVWYVCPAF